MRMEARLDRMLRDRSFRTLVNHWGHEGSDEYGRDVVM